MRIELSYISSWPVLTVAALLLLVPAAASAAQLTVRIFERGGSAPLQGVSVCLGTAARVSQFGAKQTDPKGYAVFQNIPRVALIVTASRPGFMGGQERLTGSVENRMLVLSLPVGGGGIQCPIEQGVAVREATGLNLESFLLNDGAVTTADPRVTLNNIISSHATQYRASERADFHNANWLAYEEKPQFRLSQGPGKKTVYFQVRRHAVINGAGIETRSPVLQDSIELRY